MNILNKLKDRTGFTLIQVVFALVVLSLLGVAMMRLIGVQSTTSVMAVQGARAYQAARSGLEWGAARVVPVDDVVINDDDCSGSFSVDNFQVEVECSVESFTEGTANTYEIYKINATATFGTLGSVDYISRSAEMKVGFP
jgi:MSHA biogenesis protein MshP